MKSYSIGLYEKAMPNNLALHEKLLHSKDAGYDFMEISIDESEEKLARLEYTESEYRKIMKTIAEFGIPIHTMCLSGNRRYPIGSEDEAVRIRGMEIIVGAIEFALRLGIRIIQIAGYDEYYRPSNDRTEALFAENLKKCVGYAASKGVILAFETMETEFMNTVEKAMKYVEDNHSPYLQIYPDTGNITNAAIIHNKSVIDDLYKGRGHMVAMHLKETLPGIYREVKYGKGHVDFGNCIQTARSIGTNMFTLEFWHNDKVDWVWELKEARAFFLKYFI